MKKLNKIIKFKKEKNMNIKNGLVILLITITSSLPSFAGIMEELDNLSPQEAATFREKLEKKADDAFWLNNGGTGFIQLINPKKLNKSFSGVRDIRTLYGGTFNLRVPVSKSLYVGGDFSGAGNFTTRESASKVYEDLVLGYGAAQFVLDYHIVKSDSFKLNTTAGAGIMIGGYNYLKTDENTQVSYNTHRFGLGLCSSLGINANWMIEDGWSFGIGTSYFWGSIDTVRRFIHSADSDAPEIDFSGMSINISGRKYF